MAFKKFILVLALFAMVTSSNLRRGAQERITIKSDHEYLSTEYLNSYAVPTSKFTVTNNGGNVGGQDISKAFDRNFGTLFKSGVDNSGSFSNSITVTFQEKLTLDKVLYQAEDWWGRGFPISLTLTFKDENDQVVETINFLSEYTSDIVVFKLGHDVTCKSVIFEYTKITTKHKACATAREIIFYQPESVEMEDFQNLFTDYCKFTLNEKYNSVEKVEQLRSLLKNQVSYEDSIKDTLDRAVKVLKGEIKFEERRQFTTSPTEKGAKIRQNGNIRNYAYNTLRFIWYGINKQTTGIQGVTGERFTVYVEADEKDPLPQITTSQFYGSWRGWQSRKNLKRGVNYFTFDSFYETSSPKVLKGGPIYIENPYDTSKQSSNVKIYIEGGSYFPIFRKGDDEEAYKNELVEYLATYDNTKQFDMTELEGRNFLHTIRSSMAKRYYVDAKEPRKPQDNAESWDDWLIKLLTFYGIKFDPEHEYYNPMNWHLGINVRLAQPFGAAYAITDHVGIFDDGWEGITINGKSYGWGMAHEVGHTLDGIDRTVSECTNNMISKFNEVALEKIAERGDFKQNVDALTSDRITQGKYWNTNRYNFLIWWLIESHHIGYWGESENMYRYKRTNLKTSTETQIYYASLITGFDMSYYFERWGYNLGTNDPIFTVAGASELFNSTMKQAIDDGKIRTDIQPKLWYYDKKEYTLRASGINLNAYNKEQNIKPISIDRVRSVKDGAVTYKYSLILPEPDDANAHLGYEILEGNDKDGFTVISFTYDSFYSDPTAYTEDYIPTYIIKAYDRELNSTGEKVKTQYIPQIVCRNGDKQYYSVNEAIESATSGDTIYLTKASFTETGIIVTKEITIAADPSLASATIQRGGVGAIITVKNGATLKITDPKIIIDGRNLKQSGPLIQVEGTTILENITLQNGNRNGDGGAIYKGNTKLTLTNVTFRNNKATRGGAVANPIAQGNFIDNGSIYENNEATEGGAILTKTTCDIINSTFRGNKAVKGGAISDYEGGVFKLQYSNFFNNQAQKGGALSIDGRSWISHNIITNNVAEELGGAVYYQTGVAVRSVDFTNNTLSGNKATGNNGEEVYIDSNRATFIAYQNDVAEDKVGDYYVNTGNFEITRKPEGLGFTDSVAAKFERQNNKVIFSGNNLKITITTSDDDLPLYNKERIVLETLQGAKSVYYVKESGTFIPENLVSSPEVAENQYVAWTKGIYYDNEEVELRHDETLFKMLVLNKIKVTIKIGEKTKEVYVRQEENYVPELEEADIPEGKVLSGWTVGDEEVAKGTPIVVKSEITISPVFIAKTSRVSDFEEDSGEPLAFGDEEESNTGKNNLIYILIAVSASLVAVVIALSVYIHINRKRRGEVLKNILTSEENTN